jgi:hypothetical protein
MLQTQDEKYLETQRKEKEKQVINNVGIKNYQTKQIQEKIQMKNKALKDALEAHKHEQARLMRESEDFDEYAATFIAEWEAQGRDAEMIKRNLEKTKPHQPKPKTEAERIKHDTFERLGFTCRWLPEPKYE